MVVCMKNSSLAEGAIINSKKVSKCKEYPEQLIVDISLPGNPEVKGTGIEEHSMWRTCHWQRHVLWKGWVFGDNGKICGAFKEDRVHGEKKECWRRWLGKLISNWQGHFMLHVVFWLWRWTVRSSIFERSRECSDSYLKDKLGRRSG